MAFLTEASRILGTAQGSLIYYLLILWVLVACLAMAFGQWRRARDEHTQRLLLAMGGMVFVRAVYVTAALLITFTGWLQPTIYLPPLERLADTVSIALLAWALMPSPRRGAHLWDWLLGLNLILIGALYLFFILQWSQALAAGTPLDYNTYWQSTVWAVWQLALIALAGFGAVKSHREGWGTFLAALIVLFMGGLLQWFRPPDVTNLPIWQRWANLVAYPLIAVAIYQEVLADLQVRSLELQDISQASFDEIKSLLNLSEVAKQTFSSLDLSTVLDHAVRGIARVVEADQCAIVFPEEGDASTMRLVAIYNPTRQGRGEAVTFPLEYQLAVQQAIRRKKAVVLEESETVQLKVLFALLGSATTGPLLVQPLLGSADERRPADERHSVDDRRPTEAMGAIIAGNSRSRRPFTANDTKLCQSMAEQVVAAVRNARLYQAAQSQTQELNRALTEGRREQQQAKVKLQELIDRLTEARVENQELQVREEMAREARNALEILLVSSRAEVESLAERLAVLETDLVQAHAKAEGQSRWYEEEMARWDAEWGETLGSAESIQAVLRGMTAGVLVTDVHGVIQEANLAAEILLELSAEELRGRRLEEISGDERWQQAVASANDGGAVRVTMQVGNNTLMCDFAPLPDPQGQAPEMHRLVAVLQDVSAEIEEQRAYLDAVASLTEELQAPITTIINYADLLLSETVGAVSNAQRKFLTRIRAGAERLAQITSVMTPHGLARETGEEERWMLPRRQLVDVNKLIEATVAATHCQLEDRAITLELDLPDDLPPIKADPDYLQRVLSNLLSNACLASPAGAQIRVQTDQSSNFPLGQPIGTPYAEGADDADGSHDVRPHPFVFVSVMDFGGGVSQETLERVFDPARPSQTPPGLGESGAGLAAAKMLIEAHGGRLWVESEKGVGTTFRFALPVNDTDQHSEQQEESSYMWQAAGDRS